MTLVQDVMGSNPGAIYWMDIFTLICCKNCIACLKRQKINEKEAGVGPFKKRRLDGWVRSPTKEVGS